VLKVAKSWFDFSLQLHLVLLPFDMVNIRKHSHCFQKLVSFLGDPNPAKPGTWLLKIMMKRLCYIYKIMMSLHI